MADGRLAQRISPRRKGSHWTRLNRERCAKLEHLGLMTEAGREVQAYDSSDGNEKNSQLNDGEAGTTPVILNKAMGFVVAMMTIKG